MDTDQLTDAEAFHGFLSEQLKNGGREQSPEEILRNWRLRQQREYDATVKALREAIADMENGDTGKPFDEFLDEFRKKHHIPYDV